jgi:hypothetical protein
MERSNRIRQAYGYAVCLIAVVTSLICINGVVRNVINLSDPIAAASAWGEPIDSFESWRASGRHRVVPPEGTPADTLSSDAQRAQYEAVRASVISRQRFTTRRDLATQAVLLVVAALLFVTHWRWLQRGRDEAARVAKHPHP